MDYRVSINEVILHTLGFTLLSVAVVLVVKPYLLVGYFTAGTIN